MGNIKSIKRPLILTGRKTKDALTTQGETTRENDSFTSSDMISEKKNISEENHQKTTIINEHMTVHLGN